VIYPGVGADESQAVFHHDQAGAGAQHLLGFVEDHLHQARVSLGLLRQLEGLGRGLNPGQVDLPPFGF